MNEPLYWVIAVVFFAVQLMLCLRAKRVIAKLIPVLLAVLLTALSFVLYAATVNWAWLIVCLLSSVLLIPCALAWILYGFIRLVEKMR